MQKTIIEIPQLLRQQVPRNELKELSVINVDQGSSQELAELAAIIALKIDEALAT
ncbi:MAG TPA: hypothetical protein V6D03_03540 [Candidatus Caenarcaniphilales bacterium]